MEQIIESFDYKIYTKVEGNGRPVLLLHSLWGSHILFDNLVNQLSDKYKIIRIDFPGHGNSGNPSCNFTFQKFADVLKDILDQLGISEKICFIGHSMGGYAALAFAKKYPENTSSMVLIHTTLKNAGHKSIKQRERQTRLIGNNKIELLLQVSIPSNFAPGNNIRFPDEFDQLCQTAKQVTTEGVMAGINAINTRENSLPFMMKSNIPTLMVVGAQDKINNPKVQLSEYSIIPNAELLLLLHSGHLGFIEEQNMFVVRLIEFLASVNS